MAAGVKGRLGSFKEARASEMVLAMEPRGRLTSTIVRGVNC